MGTIGDYAGLSLASTDIYTVDLAEQDYPTAVSPDASVTYNAAYGIDGGPGVRCFPPTTTGTYSALGNFDLFNAGGTANFTNFYARWCMQVGADFSDNNTFDRVKQSIFWASGGPNSTASDPIRPIMYLETRLADLAIAPAGYCVLYPAQGTTGYLSESNPADAYSGAGLFDYYFGPSDTTYLGKTVIGPTNWVCCELWCESDSTGEYPDGNIRLRATARDGTILSDLDVAMPWDHDPAAPLTKYFDTAELIGAGYFNGPTTTPGADNYVAIARYVTFAKNQTAFLGPPTGFLL